MPLAQRYFMPNKLPSSLAFSSVAVIPVYNHPATIGAMVQHVRQHALECILVDDGSTAECANVLDALVRQHAPHLSLVRLPHNQGKGAAMMAGLRQAHALGYTHALQIDADGQHNGHDITHFLHQAQQHPAAVICGHPVYDQSVPRLRFYARYLTHVGVWIECGSRAITDAMCGFRVYPLAPVLKIINHWNLGQRMDFDPEILVRLHWQGVPIVNQATAVVYPSGGISHFRAWRDTALLGRMHARLLMGMLLRLPEWAMASLFKK
jgi:glycosyltransferase involved in cell wall biosynthesis